MVKKHKGGRRQILQLEDKKLEDKKSSRSEWEPTSTAALNKESTPLDSQVADFFKEIDALTVNDHDNEGNPEAASASNDVASCSKEQDTDDSIVQEQPEKSDSNQNELQSEDLGSYCSWQEICDKNTGYVYYWNTDTNEVTWDCPEEYIMYLKSRKSVDGEDFSQSNQNSHENPKKGKRKKDPPKPPEGAIIPISYFGNSSSDESSDEETSNGLNISFPHLNHKIESKTSAPSKQRTIKKDDCHINENNGEPIETMGPHLPADHQITKMVSSASKNSFLCKEAETSSKNEVDEYLEIGPQLSSNSGIGISKTSDCNTVSDSSSKCSNVIDSIKNGPGLASSSTYEEPWEVSLMNIEKKIKGLDQDIGEESPDSTVRKVDTSSENSMPCQTTNWAAGIRGVVEYDDFTDEEEEMSSSNISSSKEESDTTCKTVSAGYNKVKDWSIQLDEKRKYDSIKSEVSQSESQRNLPKRKLLGKTDEYVDTNFKKSKQKIDIDKLFINYSNSHKYGFGFSRQEQLNIESDFFCSTSGYNQLSASKGSRDCKTINFVKSDHVFDLSTINNNISNDNFSQFKPDELDKNNRTDNICAPGPSRLNGFEEVSDSKTVLNESNNVTSDDCLSKVKEVSTSKCINGKLKHNLNSDVSCENEESLSENKNASSSKTNDDYKIEEDIDEIDRQLSEAFEAKKAETASSKPSSSFSSVCSEKKRIETDSTVSTKPVTECAKIALDILNIRSLSDDIISLSSVLIDKLSFLISNHSTLTSLSSLLIQIQTRLIDWQTGSLESRYFMSRLQEVQQYLQHYEVGAVSGDWICQWDRENKRYFYMNTRTQQSQWTYPEELCGKENSWMPSSTESASASASSDVSRERDELQTVSSSVPEGQFQNKSFSVESSEGISTKKYSDSSSLWISESSPPPPPPGVDSPPPPPPQSPPPDSPPPPPPDSTEVEDLLEDMDIENSDDSNQPLIVTNSRGDTPSDALTPYSKFPLPAPERSVEPLPSASITNAVSSTSLSGFEDMNIVLKSPQLVTTSHDTFDTVDSVNMHWSISQPSCSTDIANSFDSESEMNLMLNSKLHNLDKDSDANASSSSRSCDINASSSSSSRSCDINASSSSSSSKNCDFNASSSSSRSCDVNTSSSSTRSYAANASSSTNRNYICSNEVTTYRKPCGPYPPTLTVVSASTTTSSRKEKKKAKLSSGLALKKKNIPSLVEKWQKIKEEQEKEDKETDEDPRN